MCLEEHSRRMVDLLVEIHKDLRNIKDHLAEEPVTWQVAVSSARPLAIDKRERKHLYVFSAVALEFFYADLAGQSQSTLLAPLTIPAGVFVELPFHTGDKLLCPAIGNTTEIVVLLVAQNEVLSA